MPPVVLNIETLGLLIFSFFPMEQGAPRINWTKS